MMDQDAYIALVYIVLMYMTGQLSSKVTVPGKTAIPHVLAFVIMVACIKFLGEYMYKAFQTFILIPPCPVCFYICILR